MTTATLNVETPPKVQAFAMSGSADDALTIEPIATDPLGVQLGRYKGAVQLQSTAAWSFAKEAGAAAHQSVGANVPFTLVITGKTTIYITCGTAASLIVTTVR